MACSRVLVVYVLAFTGLLPGLALTASLQLRLSEAEFNRVAKSFFSLKRTSNWTIDDTHAYTYRQQKFSAATTVRVTTLPSGGLKTVATFKSAAFDVGQYFAASDNHVILDQCTYTSVGRIGPTTAITGDSKHTFTFTVDGDCQFSCGGFTAPEDLSNQLEKSMDRGAVLSWIGDLVCKTYRYQATFDITTKAKGFTFNISSDSSIPATNLTYLFTSVQIVDSALLFTAKTGFPSRMFSLGQDTPVIPIPQSPKQTDPVEIWISERTLDGFFADSIDNVFRGSKSINLSKVTKKLSDKNLQQLDLLIPALDQIFPNSTYGIVLTDIKSVTTLENNSFWFNFTATGAVTATLNCDPTRTYTAFTFRTTLDFPFELAFDNRVLGMRDTTVRGNCTVLSTNIGNVANRYIVALFYVLPSYLQSDSKRKYIHGIRLSDILPSGYDLDDVKIKVIENFLVISGRLMVEPTDPNSNRIPMLNLTWIATQTDSDYYYYPFIDNTPADAKGISVQDCKDHVTHTSGSVGNSINTVIFCCLYIGYLVVSWSDSFATKTSGTF